MLALVVAAVLGAVGGGIAGWRDDGPVRSGPGGSTELAAPSDAGRAVLTPDPGPVVLAFAGDVFASGQLATRLATEPSGFVGPFATVLASADLAIVNVEAAITDKGDPIDKDFAFRAPPALLGALAAGGIDVVSAANNHAIDFGPEGLARTLDLIDSPGPRIIGLGADEAAAYAPSVHHIGGHTIAVLAATQVIDAAVLEDWTATTENPGVASAKRVDRLLAAVAEARDAADTVVVYLHWGDEGEECPTVSQTELAQALSEAGADIVVGTHAHRIQGGGMLGSTLVHYGLGNFLFSSVGDDAARTGVLLVTVDGREVLDYRWEPGRIRASVPEPLTGDDAEEERSRWSDQRTCTNLGP